MPSVEAMRSVYTLFQNDRGQWILKKDGMVVTGWETKMRAESEAREIARENAPSYLQIWFADGGIEEEVRYD